MSGPNGAIDLNQMAARRQMQQQALEEMLFNVSMHIYAHLAAAIIEKNSPDLPDQLRKAAGDAKFAAPALAEKFGFCNWNVTPKAQSKSESPAT